MKISTEKKGDDTVPLSFRLPKRLYWELRGKMAEDKIKTVQKLGESMVRKYLKERK